MEEYLLYFKRFIVSLRPTIVRKEGFMDKLQAIGCFFRYHKYWLVTLVFVLIIGVFDENSLLRRASHKKEIATLKSEIEKYREQYEEDTRQLEELNSNPETIEKIARERYFMKTPDEDVFCLLYTSPSPRD